VRSNQRGNPDERSFLLLHSAHGRVGGDFGHAWLEVVLRRRSLTGRHGSVLARKIAAVRMGVPDGGMVTTNHAGFEGGRVPGVELGNS
jgi:hypothetical protein